ncbi:hypothetical protein A3D78_05660 [Candidatus Gottesmanbacteria bacterium RIFCSPHIGHO2_02_FULL_39_14]|uniref:Ribbon-helix-helix protein CopG domain-containing protein n=1 Tax=Candidatus Gottesmanbacteria bacterium RIFCSPHIGHO2_02_FULL_39_14 TaxID=1798383 RepID=A0A1F6A316_9BACT|nr:MAG: hypothetical protein A3D78_05660 [Candidatus Gottesmanbacteria bacterium RIFCSPHIGHO2_02_FULL_39_14]
MSTVNISIPQEQLNFIDKLVNNYGFANRSEFIRALIRLLAFKPELINQTALFPFSVPSSRSRVKIIADFRKSGKYSKSFIKDLEEGLKTSDFFTD